MKLATYQIDTLLSCQSLFRHTNFPSECVLTKNRIVGRLFDGCKIVFIKINYHEFRVQYWMVVPLDLVQSCPFTFICAINLCGMDFWRVLWVVEGAGMDKNKCVAVESERFPKLTLNNYILTNPRSFLVLCWCIIDCNILRPHKQSNLWCVKDLLPKKQHWCGFVLLSHRINMNSDFWTYYFIERSFARRFIMLHVSTFGKHS